MRRILPLAIILLLCEINILVAGNPVMLVRCRAQNLIELITEGGGCSGANIVEYLGHCYVISEDGITCPEISEFDLESLSVMIDGQSVDICVPVCSTFDCPDCYDDPYWNFDDYQCECEDLEGEILACDYPTTPMAYECYDGALDIVVQPFICDLTIPDEVVTIVIKPAPGQRPGDVFAPDDVLTVNDLQNCELIDGTNAYTTLFGLYGGDAGDRAAFGVDPATGCIVIEFTRDPSLPSVIVTRNANVDIVIPPCAGDPCRCRPENVTDMDGIVQLWYDELTISGTPNARVSLLNDNSVGGFLDPATQMPFGPLPAMLGTLDGNGDLIVPFFRTPGVPTDIDLFETTVGAGNNRFYNFKSECTLRTDACVAIVPTLGEWALIILGLILMIVGTVAIAQPKQEFN